MPGASTPIIRYKFDRFTEGVHSYGDGGEASYTTYPRMTDSQNMRITPMGHFVVRRGSKRILSSAMTYYAATGYSWRQSGASDPTEIIVNSNGDVGTFNLNTAWPPTISYRGVTNFTGIVHGTATEFRDGTNDCVYFGSSLSARGLCKVTAASQSVDLSVGAPKVSILAVYNNRLYGVNPDSPGTLLYSALGNGDTLGNAAAGGGSVNIRTFGSDDITGLASVGASLLIFTRTSIARFTGWSQDDININLGTSGVSNEVGAIPNTLAIVNNTAYFMSERGFYLANESGVRPMDTGMNTQHFAGGGLNGEYPVINPFWREIWWRYLNDRCIVYNYERDRWYGQFISASNQYYRMWTTWYPQWGRPVVIGSTPEGWLVVHDPSVYGTNYAANPGDEIAYDSAGASRQNAITAYVRLPYMDLGDSLSSKGMRYVYVDGWGDPPAAVGLTSISGALDTGGTDSQLSLSFLPVAEMPARAQTGVRGRSFSVTLARTLGTSEVDWHLASVELEAAVYGRRY